MNIYIGFIDENMNENELRSIFEKYGDVNEARIIKNRSNGISRGFGYVVMDNDIEAQNAIDELHGTILNDQQIIVNKARDKNTF